MTPLPPLSPCTVTKPEGACGRPTRMRCALCGQAACDAHQQERARCTGCAWWDALLGRVPA